MAQDGYLRKYLPVYDAYVLPVWQTSSSAASALIASSSFSASTDAVWSCRLVRVLTVPCFLVLRFTSLQERRQASRRDVQDWFWRRRIFSPARTCTACNQLCRGQGMVDTEANE